MSDRELHAYLAAYDGEPAPAGFSDAQIEAAAKAMYETRPKHTDPARWETPWDEVPEAWKQGQYQAALRVLEAARDARSDQ